MNAIPKLTIPRLTLGMFLFAGPLALAGQEADQPGAEATEPAVDIQEGDQGKVVLQESARTIDEALNRRSEQESAAAAELKAARTTYENRMAAVNRHAIADLEGIARRAVADGKLAAASAAWMEVLKIDSANESAKTFFNTIGREDVVEQLAGARGINAGTGNDKLAMDATASWEDLKPATIRIIGKNYDIGTLATGSVMFTNRSQYKWETVPSEVNGWAFVTGEAGNPPAVEIVPLSDGNVFMLLPLKRIYDPDNPKANESLAKSGWSPVKLVDAPFEPYILLTKHAKRGRRIAVPHFHGFGFTFAVHPTAAMNK